MAVKKTESIWDDIVSMILNFLKKYWKSVTIMVCFILLAAGIALSPLKIKAGNVEIDKGKADIGQFKR